MIIVVVIDFIDIQTLTIEIVIVAMQLTIVDNEDCESRGYEEDERETIGDETKGEVEENEDDNVIGDSIDMTIVLVTLSFCDGRGGTMLERKKKR